MENVCMSLVNCTLCCHYRPNKHPYQESTI